MPDPSVSRVRSEAGSAPVFELPVERISEGDAPRADILDSWRTQYVNPNETVRLRVNPEDLPLLSDRWGFVLNFLRRLSPEERLLASGGDTTVLTLGEKTQYYGKLLVCSCAQDGDRYEVATYRGDDFRSDDTFWKDHMELGSTGVLGYCWKVLWIPAAVVADVAALPVYGILACGMLKMQYNHSH